MKPVVVALARSPDRRLGLARDMRLRRALEEVGQPYDVQFVSFAERSARERRFESKLLNAALPVSGHEGRKPEVRRKCPSCAQSRESGHAKRFLERQR